MENSVNDLVIRVKNGYMAKKDVITSPFSKFREQVVKKLKEIGYVGDYKVSEVEGKKEIVINLVYKKGVADFTDVRIFSTSGRRFYVSYKDLKQVVSGYGYSILSTPSGIMTNREARAKKVGGELLFNIW